MKSVSALVALSAMQARPSNLNRNGGDEYQQKVGPI
jgi:hypothetical protein